MLCLRPHPLLQTLVMAVALGLGSVAPLPGQIAADSVSSASAAATSTVTWTHTLGAGANRFVLVGVAVEDGSAADSTVSQVRLGTQNLTAVAGTKITGGGSSRMQTEWFAAPEALLPAAGEVTVTVTFAGTVDAVVASALSFRNVLGTSPEAVGTKNDTSGADTIATAITSLTHGAVVVDLIGSGNAGRFTPDADQTEKVDRDGGTVMSAAVSTRPVPAAGSVSLSWAHVNAPRLTHSLVVLAPAEAGPPPVFHALTVTTSGSGSVGAMPTAAQHLAGSTVVLTATPVAGWEFSGWSGAVTATTNPLSLVMDGPRSITATFTFVGGVPDVTLTVTTAGEGLVARSPLGPVYPAGTAVTLTATPASGWRFAGWSGGATGTTNPLTLTLSADVSVQATFQSTAGAPDFSLIGWATQGSGTTGRAGGPVIPVRTYAELVAALSLTTPAILQVAGTITGVGDSVSVLPNKSILGVGSGATLANLGLQIGWNSAFGTGGNVIIRNLTFERVRAPTDKVLIAYGAKNVWVDHCTFVSDRDNGTDYYDGQLDITHGADFVTVSWCRFVDHFKNSLVGHSENNGGTDRDHLTVTYHHNAFLRTNSRNPSVRFRRVHVFNNYYLDISDYGIASRQGAQVVVENNFFRNVVEPMNADTNLSNVAGFIRGVETNIFENCGPNSIITAPATWVPPYAYTLRPAADVPSVVLQFAGADVFDPTAPPPADTAPTIVTQPVSVAVNAGTSALLSVVATGSPPPSFQWQRNGENLPGATSSALTLPDVQEANLRTYRVVVSNPFGTVTSDPATVSLSTTVFAVMIDPQPESQSANPATPSPLRWGPPACPP